MNAFAIRQRHRQIRRGGTNQQTPEDRCWSGSSLFRLSDGSCGPSQHLSGINSDGSGDAEQGFKGRIPHLAFNVAHHLLRQPGALGHKIHGELPPFPFLAQNLGYAGADGLLRLFVGCHDRKISPIVLTQNLTIVRRMACLHADSAPIPTPSALIPRIRKSKIGVASQKIVATT